MIATHYLFKERTGAHESVKLPSRRVSTAVQLRATGTDPVINNVFYRQLPKAGEPLTN